MGTVYRQQNQALKVSPLARDTNKGTVAFQSGVPLSLGSPRAMTECDLSVKSPAPIPESEQCEQDISYCPPL